MTRLILGKALRARLEAEARAAFPRECCGLIEGLRDGDSILATHIHPTRNMAGEPDRFEIDPAEQIRLLRAAREAGRSIVGCYHSHPNGKAEPSARDRDAAGEEGLAWLVAALTGPDGPISVSAFRSVAGDFRPLPLTDMTPIASGVDRAASQ